MKDNGSREMKLAPMIKEYPYNNQGLKEFEEGESREESKIISRYPTVYVVNDKKKKKIYSVYVGETNNITKRTAQHLHGAREVWKMIGRMDGIINNNLSEKQWGICRSEASGLFLWLVSWKVGPRDDW